MMAQARVQVIERRRLRSSTTSSPHTVQNTFTSSRCVIQVFSHIAQCFSSDTLGAVVAHFGTTIFGVVIAVANTTNSTITQRLRVCDLPECFYQDRLTFSFSVHGVSLSTMYSVRGLSRSSLWGIRWASTDVSE